MKTRVRGHHAKREANVADLLKQARAQPGVATLLRVYHNLEAVVMNAQPYSLVMQETPLITASDTSKPSCW
jgi:hypothetical protein